MKKTDYTGIVPQQYTGSEIESEASTDLKSDEEAKYFFKIARQRLLDVNNWHRVAEKISARFQVVNKDGEEEDRQVKEGDYLRIDIPGPGRQQGDGYDWVYVETINELKNHIVQSVGLRVRPHPNPFDEKSETAHFYSREATSSFIVTRESSRVSSWIIDRNLVPNKEAESLADRIRDTAVGLGAIAGFSKIQWQGLANGLVATNGSLLKKAK
ncbi:MAG TPA: hypothetical protein VFX58_13160 [Chitinophagaceae bacterium]|nr:hypothetical protein [Chitinophagaceae bacterium]